MKLSQKWVYLTLIVSFALLLYSLILSYVNLNKNSKVLKKLSSDQIALNHYANNLNFSVKKNQSDTLQSLALNHDLNLSRIEKSQKDIFLYITELQTSLKINKNFSQELNTTLKLLEKRAIEFKTVQYSLITAKKLNNTKSIQDALVHFDMVSLEFSQDISTLMEQVRNSFDQQIEILKETNDQNSSILIFSTILSILLIIMSLLKFYAANIRISKQLQLKAKAQRNLKDAKKQLQKYNENLEHEVNKKTKELRKKIYTHFLSGLPNRHQLLEDTLHQNYTKMALLNIDKFQSFNDVYGENVGNIALQQTAQWLVEHINTEDYSLYHLSGDEFVIASTSQYFSNTLFIDFIEMLLKKFKRTHFVHENRSYQFIMSAGITFTGEDKMLAYADMALKDAKKKNLSVSIFEDDKQLEHNHKEDIEIQKKLLYALEHNGLSSYYQPIVPIRDVTKEVKYESLVRLIDRDFNVISPLKFLDIAKQNRVYYKITKQVLHNTLEAITKHQVPCSLNLCMTDIKNERTVQYLYSLLSEFEYNHLLTIELLETEDFDNYTQVYSFCMKVRAYGVKIALDDFGSGYSNFSHILNLPVDYIKIDSSLISNIDRDISSQIMVETIVALAKKLNIETIAEFVSSEDILEMVRSLRVDYVQGFHIGKPLPIEDHLKTTFIF